MTSTPSTPTEATVPPSAPSPNGVRWRDDISPDGWQALIAAGLAWTFEVFDFMLLPFSTPALLHDFGVSKGQIGLTGTLAAVGMIAGGILGGAIADRIGRVKLLTYAITTYAVLTGAAALSPDLTWFTALRFLAATGMGATWTAGSALIAETWPKEHRGKGGALMQIGMPAGSLLAIAVTALVASASGSLDDGGWRILYALGALPILLALYVRLRLREPAVWSRERAARKAAGRPLAGVRALLVPGVRGPVLTVLTFVFFLQYMYYGVLTFLPTYLVEVHGMNIGHSLQFMLLQQVGAIVGMCGFAAVSDRWGRRPTFVTCLLVATVAVVVLVTQDSSAAVFTANFLVGLGVTGTMAGVGPWAAEMTHRAPGRALAMGVAYNGGRVGGSLAPYIIGSLAVNVAGFKLGLGTAAVAALVAIVVMLCTQETKGRTLAPDLST